MPIDEVDGWLDPQRFQPFNDPFGISQETSMDERTTFWAGMGSRGFYFRIRGYGLAVDNALPVLFSERYGHRRVLRIGRWALQLLKPTPSAGERRG